MELNSALAMIVKGIESTMNSNGFSVIVPADTEKGALPVSEKNGASTITYGGKNGVDADPYKSIILNYNNFSVSIVYEDMVYTIPAYGYVVVMK